MNNVQIKKGQKKGQDQLILSVNGQPSFGDTTNTSIQDPTTTSGDPTSGIPTTSTHIQSL